MTNDIIFDAVKRDIKALKFVPTDFDMDLLQQDISLILGSSIDLSSYTSKLN